MFDANKMGIIQSDIYTARANKVGGRHQILKLISGRSLSTKKFLLSNLQRQVKGDGAEQKLGRLAKRLGVKIKLLELE